MTSKFDSFDQTPLGAFTQSPLGARGISEEFGDMRLLCVAIAERFLSASQEDDPSSSSGCGLQTYEAFRVQRQHNFDHVNVDGDPISDRTLTEGLEDPTQTDGVDNFVSLYNAKYRQGSSERGYASVDASPFLNSQFGGDTDDVRWMFALSAGVTLRVYSGSHLSGDIIVERSGPAMWYTNSLQCKDSLDCINEYWSGPLTNYMDFPTSIDWDDGVNDDEPLMLFTNDTFSTTSCLPAPDEALNAGSFVLFETATPPDGTPFVRIKLPIHNNNFNDGQTVDFEGEASDPGVGDLGSNLSWSSSIDGNIGSGKSFSTSTLSIGDHTITASVTDAESKTGQAQVQISVNDVTAPDVTITNPSDNDSFSSGTEINFTGTAIDDQDGDISESIDWVAQRTSDSQVEQMGTGSSINYTLPDGEWTVVAIAEDEAGNTGSDSIVITVG